MKNPAALRLAGLPGDCSPGKRSATGVRQRICGVKGAPHLTQHFALQKGVKTRHPRELTSVSDRG